MEDTDEPGQGFPAFESPEEPPLAVVARAVLRLQAAGRLQLPAWADAYASLRPIGHPGAGSLLPDLGFLGAAWGIGGQALFGASEIVVTESAPRALPQCDALDEGRVSLQLPPGLEAAGDALALALGLDREADKLKYALVDGDDPLDVAARAHGITPAALAEEVGAPVDELALGLRALVGGRTRSLALARKTRPAPLDEVVLELATESDALFVLAGATERVHDLISPYARRLGPQLSALAGGAGDDAAYDGISVLVAHEPAAHDERVHVESREGITSCGPAVVLRFDAIDPATVDLRARNTVRALKAKHAAVVLCDRDPATLTAVLKKLGQRVRVLGLLAEGIAPGVRAFPDVVVDPVSGHPLELDNALTDAAPDDDRVATFVSPPSLGFTPVALLEGHVGSAPLAYPLLYAAIASRARGELGRRTRLALGTFAPGDSPGATQVALRCLERMAGGPPPPRRRP